MYRAILLHLARHLFLFRARTIRPRSNQHGDHVMGFSHEKTTHHFVLTADGGLIEVRAKDIKDTASLNQIRSHFQHIARMFAAGDFNAPMLVHSRTSPALPP